MYEEYIIRYLLEMGSSEVRRSNHEFSNEDIDSSDQDRLEYLEAELNRRTRPRNHNRRRSSSSKDEIEIAEFLQQDIDLNQDLENDDCLICASQLKEKRMAYLECKHIFHKKCIKNWLKKDTLKSCPQCRVNANIQFYVKKIDTNETYQDN